MNCQDAINCQGLTRYFEHHAAVKKLNLKVGHGEIFGLLGHNGAGKTTTIRMLLGLLRPTSGTALVLGHNISNDATTVRAKTGVLFDNPGLYQNLTAWDNLDYFSRINRIEKVERNRRIMELLHLIGLWDRRTEQVKTWSRGMQQQLAIVRAMIGNPKLLILDEPTAGLDPQSVKAIRELLLQLVADSQCTIFLCTHNLNEAEKICSRVGIIRKGEIVAMGKPTDLRRSFGERQTEIRCSVVGEQLLKELMNLEGVQSVSFEDSDILRITWKSQDQVDIIVETLVNNGVRVKSVLTQDRSFEDSYLSYFEGDMCNE